MVTGNMMEEVGDGCGSGVGNGACGDEIERVLVP